MHYPSFMSGLVTMKCPRCRKGNLFIDPNPYKNILKVVQMPKQCPKCGQAYYPEPGFYFGAMYLAYLMASFYSGFNVIWLWLIFGFHLWTIIIGNAAVLILTFPLLYRYSRALWAYIMIRFDKGVCTIVQTNDAAQAALAPGRPSRS